MRGFIVSRLQNPRHTVDYSSWTPPWKGVERTVGVNTQWEYMDKTKLEYLNKLLPQGGITLEVGCGSARISAWLAQRDFYCCCLDNSKYALRLTRANFKYVGKHGEFILADAFRLPFRDSSFDMVFSTGLLEHFEDPLPLLQEMYRVLKQGGLFYSDILPNKFSLAKLMRTLLLPAILLYRKSGKMGSSYLFEKRMSKIQIKDYVESAGFANVRVASDWIVPLLPLPDGNNVPFGLLNRVWGLLLYKSRPTWKLLAGTKIGNALCLLYYVDATKQ
jgi:ubiquinone/menaquinone biosynthesis C-methylase UbiE